MTAVVVEQLSRAPPTLSPCECSDQKAPGETETCPECLQPGSIYTLRITLACACECVRVLGGPLPHVCVRLGEPSETPRALSSMTQLSFNHRG